MCIRDSKDTAKETKSSSESSGITGTTPVSYTHLDVYKRQIIIIIKIKFNNCSKRLLKKDK